MMLSRETISALLVASLASGGVALAAKRSPIIGETEKVYTLASANQAIRGLAVDQVSGSSPRLFVLDGSGKIFTYQWQQEPAKGIDELTLLKAHDLPALTGKQRPASPRGLAFAVEGDRPVLYFLNWGNAGGQVTSQLWRVDLERRNAVMANLSLYDFRIGAREVLDVACDENTLLVSFDGSGYTDSNLRVRRGIIRLKWDEKCPEKLTFVRHLCDSGTFPSRGLAVMELDGARYLWATVGDEHVYCADATTGRGLFHFPRPTSAQEGTSCWGLAFGAKALWVSENGTGPARIHRVNVTKNLEAAAEGPRILRHLTMTIETEPETAEGEPGKVYHYYSRPYAYEQLGNQGTWPDTETVAEDSAAANGTVKRFTHDPAGDVASRQHMALVEYANAPARVYSSKYEIDIWTNAYRKFVYPHRVNRDESRLKGTTYREDDPELYNLTDTRTYRRFVERVARHIEKKYGVTADMKHPYWAARNALEYIQDSYYYPGREQRKPATVDYARGHYDANPGNLKIELSDREYDKTQIIACSGTSVVLAGAMRYLGFPARWLGTGFPRSPKDWDTNGNGLLDEGEAAPCRNGHRYTQVWLGSNYGWICFDATPSRPDFMDYDPPPPLRPQWRYMNRAAAGHLKDKRIVFNVGSRLFRPLYRDFEYDEKLAVDNNCGGDQRYNLQGRFDKPEKWKLPRHRSQVKNLCFIEKVTVTGPKDKTKVTWELKGSWEKTPQATLSAYLQQVGADGKRAQDVARVAQGIPCAARLATLDLSAHHGKGCRIILRKDGDWETGGQSPRFDLP